MRTNGDLRRRENGDGIRVPKQDLRFPDGRVGGEVPLDDESNIVAESRPVSWGVFGGDVADLRSGIRERDFRDPPVGEQGLQCGEGARLASCREFFA